MVVQLLIGNQVACDLPTFGVGRAFGRVVLCPHCLKGTTLVSNDAAGPFRFDEEDALNGYTAFRNVPLHLAKCASRFPQDGVYPVNDPDRIRMAEELTAWSRREARWDAPLFHPSMFKRGGCAYLSVRQGGVCGYGVFTTRDFEEVGRRTYIEDLYTFPPFRRQGVARQLLDHAMQALTFGPDLLPVSVPVRPEAAALIASVARERGAQVMSVSRKGYSINTVDDFLANDVHP